MVEKKTASKAGRAAMPGPWNRPSFSRSISYLSTFRSLRASVSHTGSACRMPFRVTGGRSRGGLLAGRSTGWSWTPSASTFLGTAAPCRYLGASQPRSRPRRCGRPRRGRRPRRSSPARSVGRSGVSDEHQDVDIARRSGVAPRLRPVHHESLEEPAGRLVQSFDVVLEPQPLVRLERRSAAGFRRRESALGGVGCAGHRASPCPTALPASGHPFAQAMKRSVVAFPPKSARSKRRASLLTSAMGISSYPICSTHTLIRRSYHRRLQVDVAVDVHAAGGDVVQGHVREEQVGFARRVGARRHFVEPPPEAADVRIVVVPSHEDLAAGSAPEAVDQAVRRTVHGDVAQTDDRVVVLHVVRPLLQQVAVAVVAAPEWAARDADARLVSEVRVGEHPHSVFVPRAQPCAQQAPGCVQSGRGGVPVVNGDALVPRLGRSAAPRRAVEARSRSCPFHDGNRPAGDPRSFATDRHRPDRGSHRRLPHRRLQID